jgi:hypothetical protein
MKASGNLRFLVVHPICRVDMAPIHVGTDWQVIIWPQTHFALWTLASVDTNTIMRSLRRNVKIDAKFSEALASMFALPSTTHSICYRYFIDSDQYRLQLSALFHLSAQVLCDTSAGRKWQMTLGRKNNLYWILKKILRENANWFELDPSRIKRMAFDFVIKKALVSIYQYCRSQKNTHFTNSFY